MSATSNSSSDELWAEFDRTPPAYAAFDEAYIEDYHWQQRLDRAYEKYRIAEEEYKLALREGVPSYHLATELTYAQRAIDELHEERRRREAHDREE